LNQSIVCDILLHLEDDRPNTANAEPFPTMTLSPTTSDSTATPELTNVATEPKPKRFWFSIFVILVLLTLAGSAQYRDLLNDRSISNAVSMITVGVAALVLLSMVFRFVAQRKSWLLAAIVTVGLALTPFALFRLKGFSGEIIPVLEFRFRSGAELQSIVTGSSDTPTPTEVATTSFAQFLGANRDAIIEPREFAVPNGNEEEMWRTAIGEGWSSFAIQDQYCVTLEQREERECVTCYRLDNGSLLWIHEETARHENAIGGIGPRSTPTIVGDMVYAQGATGIVQCLKLATGELIWKQSLLELAGWPQTESEASIMWGRAASPLLVNNLCIVPFGRPFEAEPTSPLLDGRSLIAFDALTGEPKWTAGGDQISFASPVVLQFGETSQIVSVNEATVTGHNAVDGKELWSLPWPGQSNGGANCASVVPAGVDSFLLAKGYGIGCGVFTVALDGERWTVEEKWKSHRVLKTKFTHACVDGNVAYALSDGTLECVDITDGNRLWAQSRATRYGHGQIMRVGDCLVVQAEAGNVAFVAASPDEYKELATMDALSSKSWNVPSIAGRYLAVRNDVEAVMYRLPTK